MQTPFAPDPADSQTVRKLGGVPGEVRRPSWPPLQGGGRRIVKVGCGASR
jgi:hypothetical protein